VRPLRANLALEMTMRETSPARRLTNMARASHRRSHHGAAWRCYLAIHCFSVIVVIATRPNIIKGESSFYLHNRRTIGGFLSTVDGIVLHQRRTALSSRDDHRRIDHIRWRRRRRSIASNTNEQLFQLRSIRQDDNDGERFATLYTSTPFKDNDETCTNETKHSHTRNWDNNNLQQRQRRISSSTFDNRTRRQFVISSTALITTTAILSLSSFSSPVDAAMTKKSMQSISADNRDLAEATNFQRSPINKRSGVTLTEPERIVPCKPPSRRRLNNRIGPLCFLHVPT
jgi:hypothetical protein